MLINNATLTGSLTINNTSFNVTNGVMAGTASVAISSSYAATASLTTTASYAATASYASAFTVGGTLTAQTLVVQTVTSSVSFITGSTRFGSLSSNTHQFTGSLFVTGGLSVTSGSIGIGTINPVGMLDIQQSNITNMGISFMNTYGASGASGSTVDISSKLVGSGLTGQIGSMIRTGKEGDYSSGGARDAYMSFSTALNDNLNEAMRITSAGIVQIKVPSSADQGILFKDVADVSRAKVYYDDISGQMTIGTMTGYSTVFVTNNTERMRVANGGYLEMRPLTFSGVANNAIQTVFSSMSKGTWFVSVANDVDSTDGYVAMLWVRTNQIIEMQVFRVDSMAFSYTNQDLKIQNLSGFSATLYVTAIRMAAS